MGQKHFHGGVHPPANKHWTESKQTEKAPLPEEVIIPLQQHIGAPAEPLVQKGDTVLTGQMIGKSAKYVSVPVHATVSGTIAAIENRPHPFGLDMLSVVIRSDGEDRWKKSPEKDPDFLKLSPDDIKTRIMQAGIAGMGGASFPTHVKLSPPATKVIDTIILNGAECEPYLTADHRLMLEKPKEIMHGLAVMMRILNVTNAFIGIEDNKPDAIRIFEKILRKNKKIKVVPLHVKYPQGGEKQLIKAVINRVVPAGGLPMDIGCIVHNVGTAFSVYEAVAFQKPLIERIVTVTGSAVREPKNLLVRIGTPFHHVIGFCGGLASERIKIIHGGPMMGISQTTDKVPVIKGTSGILALNGNHLSLKTESPCIGCARCVDICPMKLVPTQLGKLVKHNRIETLDKMGIMQCMECGCCGYICPAKIPLVQYIKLGKALWTERQRQQDIRA